MTKEGAIFPLPFYIIAFVLFYFFHRDTTLTYLYLSAGLFYCGLLVMLFFRDPDRKVPDGENLIVSPADGKVIRLEGDCEAPSVSIFLALHNVHVNRSPVDGVIKSVTHHPGRFLAAFREEAMRDNQRNEIEIETAHGVVRMHQVTGALARRTIFYKKPGDRVKAGERVGLIRFGSRVDLFLPPGSKLDAMLGSKVRAGETVMGKLR
jgi:phosphatidylserine decarboxylase